MTISRRSFFARLLAVVTGSVLLAKLGPVKLERLPIAEMEAELLITRANPSRPLFPLSFAGARSGRA